VLQGCYRGVAPHCSATARDLLCRHAPEARLLLHCCHTAVTLVSNYCPTVVVLLSHCYYTLMTLLVHCCTVVTQLLHCGYTLLHCAPKAREDGSLFSGPDRRKGW
jgi:hypothetical protein